jgi:regulator of sigma E protease
MLNFLHAITLHAVTSILLEILIVLVIIFVLVLVHEFGHFVVAKLSGMRVDEFGIGFPPRALTIGKIGETEYTLNWLPIGGFVRIYGEDGQEGVEPNPRAFTSKPRSLQALTLIAGIVMNFILAYVLITTSLIIGTQEELSNDAQLATAKNLQVAFAAVTPGGPAAQAGFLPGDIITSATSTSKTSGINYDGDLPAGYVTLIGIDTALNPITFSVNRNGRHLVITATPRLKTIPSAPARPALGVQIVSIGVIKTPAKEAIVQAGQVEWNEVKYEAIGLFDFFKSFVLFKPDLSQVSGPIGIAGVVGQASSNGFGALLSLTALISVSLALFNLIPIPALDGGRLLFVIIEAIIERPIHQKIAERINMAGLVIIGLLFVIVCIHDILNLIK